MTFRDREFRTVFLTVVQQQASRKELGRVERRYTIEIAQAEVREPGDQRAGLGGELDAR